MLRTDAYRMTKNTTSSYNLAIPILNKIFLLVLSFWLPEPLFSQSQRYFVDLSAGGQNSGQSWTDAFTDLHDALALAGAGDDIWVAQGIYYPSGTGDRSARFQLLSGARLYGGFTGTELDLSERDPAVTPSVLDGDIGVPEDSTDNAYNLLYLYRPDSLTVVDGFTFRSALANDPAAVAGEVGSSGGALYIMVFDGEAYPLIRNCVFDRNTALRHGGSWVDRPEDIKDCQFNENSTYLQGGAVYFADSPRSDTFDLVSTLWSNNRINYEHQIILQGAGMQINNLRSNDATVLSIHDLQSSGHNTGESFICVGDGISFAAQNLIVFIDSIQLNSTYGISGEILGWAQASVKNSTFINSSGIGISMQPGTLIGHSIFQNITVSKTPFFGFFIASETVTFFHQEK